MSSRKKRTVLTIAQKVEILNKISDGTDQAQLSDAYGVSQSVVSRIKKKENAIRQLWEAGQVKVKSCENLSAVARMFVRFA
jgi:hypothetical protein